MEHCGCETEHICASSVPIFKALGMQELRKVNDLIRKMEYHKGNILFMQGSPSDYLCIVRYGRVKFYETSRDGRQQIVRILEQGDFFGEFSLFRVENHTLNAEAMEDTGLCLIPREDFKELISLNPEISLNIMQSMSERLVSAENFIVDLALKSTEERLAAWLLSMADKQGLRTSQGVKIKVTFSRQELANLLGTTIETVSRKLSKMQSEGIIAIEGQKDIIILDQVKLDQLIN